MLRVAVPNKGSLSEAATEMLTADQEIFHTPEHPSAINLPVVGRAAAAG